MNAASQAFELQGKRVVVTGGLTGIGQAIALDCEGAGAKVIVASRDAKKGKRDAERMRSQGRSIEYRFLDVADSESCSTFFEELELDGGLDVLVNNAGVTNWSDSLAADAAEAWRTVMGVNLDGVWRCSVGAARLMRGRGGGSIVNVGSMSGSIVNRPQSQTAYNTSKAAVHHLTRSLAVEWSAHGIRVNAVAPGYVATDMLEDALQDPEKQRFWVDDTVLKRVGDPQEIAHAVRFLAAEASSYVTGAVLPVDGGYTLW